MHNQHLLDLIHTSLAKVAETRIDWRAEIADAVLVLRDNYSQYATVLESADFLALVESYNAESAEDYLPALGQELSCHGLALYNLEEDSDSYCLLLIAATDTEAFEAAAKAIKQRVHLQKQARKKPGDPARRMKLAMRLAYEKQPINGRLDLNFPFLICEKCNYDDGAYVNSDHFIGDMQSWPRTFHVAPPIQYTALGESQVFCAIVEDADSGSGKLFLSATPLQRESWQQIPHPLAADDIDLPALSNPFWVGEDLLILHENRAWWVAQAASLTSPEDRRCQSLVTVRKEPTLRNGVFPNHVRTLDGSDYFLLYKQFYRWEDHQLQPTGMAAVDHVDFNAFATGAQRFVYVANGTLIEVDMRAQRSRSRPLPHLDLKLL